MKIKARQKASAARRALAEGATRIGPHARVALISQSAYFRSAHRGFESGHEVDDWLAAESEIDAAVARGELSPLGG